MDPLYFAMTKDHTWLSITEKQYNVVDPEFRMKVWPCDTNLSCKSVQKRLATTWGYVSEEEKLAAYHRGYKQGRFDAEIDLLNRPKVLKEKV